MSGSDKAPAGRETPRPARGWRSGLACLIGVIVLAVGSPAGAAKPGAANRPATRAPAEEGVRWQDLKPSQQRALAPLERDWSSLDTVRKRKWLRIASRYPRLSAAEQARMQARMTDWSNLTPQQRGQARLNFREAKELPSDDRQARWEAYQELSEERKQELADRAKASRPGHRSRRANPSRSERSEPSRADAPARPDHRASPPRAVAPTVVRAGRGATTTLISRQGAPWLRRDGGPPGSAAAQELVDPATLLPRRMPRERRGAARPDTPTPDPAARDRP